jgi:protein-tyrosine phosphatase
MILRLPAYARSRAKARTRLPAVACGESMQPLSTPAFSPPRRALLKCTLGTLALGGCASTLLSACGGDFSTGDPALDARTPVLNSVANFRDIGGAPPGYATSDGAHFRRAWLYRSDVLAPDATDAVTLARLGLVCIYDLRTPAENESAPGMELNNATRIALNVLGTPAPPSFDGLSGAELDVAMQAQWREFITGRAQCVAYGALLEHIAATPGPQLICGGTRVDVVGWASALLLLMAGVPLEIIVKDFLLTNGWRPVGVDASNTAPAVQSIYLQTAFDALQSSYGDLNRYLGAGLGLASTTVDLLRRRLVV